MTTKLSLGFLKSPGAYFPRFLCSLHLQSFFLFIFVFNLFLIGEWLLYNVFISTIQQCESAISKHMPPHSYASLPPPPHPNPLGHHRAPSWAPCVVEQCPTSYLFYTWGCRLWGHTESDTTEVTEQPQQCVCVYIYIYIYIYTHTHTHTLAHRQMCICTHTGACVDVWLISSPHHDCHKHQAGLSPVCMFHQQNVWGHHAFKDHSNYWGGWNMDYFRYFLFVSSGPFQSKFNYVTLSVEICWECLSSFSLASLGC